MNIQQHFELFPLLSALLWLFIVFLLAGFQKSKNEDNKLYQDFLPNIFFKVFAAIGYGIVYTTVYEDGGDTLAYWDGAVNLNNLFWESPTKFFNEIFSTPNLNTIHVNFNSKTGMPPGWIYREPESFFVSKIVVLFTFITFKSYWATTIIFGYISAIATWNFYLAIEKFKLNHPFWLRFGILYIPSVAFWCSGISKDTAVYVALMWCISKMLNFHFDKEKKFSKYFSGILMSAFFIFKIRTYILVALAPSLLIGFSTILGKKTEENRIKKWTLKFIFYLFSGLILLVFLQANTGELSISSIIDQVIVIQKDFATNAVYGTNKYDLQIQDYSTFGIIRSIPAALLAAFYRPFPWESLNIVLVLNGIESIILLYLTYLFLTSNFKKKLQKINNNEILMASFIFILVMGFSVGFTSGLFGVLVRLKCVILPFLVLLLSVLKSEVETEMKPKSSNL